MAKVITTTIVDDAPVRQEHEIGGGNRFTVIVHQQGIKVDVPEFVEINPQDTIRCMDEMSQPQWEWISQGGIFGLLWNEAFDEDNAPPTNIEVLNMADMGLRHMAGMIVLGCEACMAEKSVFFRNPETYLHPKAERRIVLMLEKMLKAFGKGGEIKVEIAKYTKKDGTVVKAHERTQKVAPPPPTDPGEDKLQCLKWLQTLQAQYGPGKELVGIEDGERLTVEQLAQEINQDTPRGRWMVAEYTKLRDK